MAFATVAALIFAVGCDTKNPEEPAIGLKMSVNPAEFEFNDCDEAGDVDVWTEDAATWSVVVPEQYRWIIAERVGDRVHIEVGPIEPDDEDNIKSRSGHVDVNAVRGKYNRILPIEVKQYADNEIPSDGPIHFYDKVLEQILVEDYDVDENGRVSPYEARKAKELYCSGRGITSLTGIEYFYNLTIADFRNNSLKVVDLSRNTKLTSLDLRENPLIEVVLGKEQEIADLKIDDASVIVRR